MKTILMLLVALSVAGCSYRAAYENIQINRRNECLKLPQSRYEECMEGVNQSYDEYERERQEYLKEREESGHEFEEDQDVTTG